MGYLEMKLEIFRKVFMEKFWKDVWAIFPGFLSLSSPPNDWGWYRGRSPHHLSRPKLA